MTNPELVVPIYTKLLYDQFLQYAEEAVAEQHWWAPLTLDEVKADFQRYLKILDGQSKGIVLTANLVPSSDFWLVDSCKFIGHVRLRHSLNEKLTKFGGHVGYYVRQQYRRQGYGCAALKAVFPIAKELGLSQMLITCDDTNLGSIRVIEKCGGVLRDKIMNEGRTVTTRRYWIEL